MITRPGALYFTSGGSEALRPFLQPPRSSCATWHEAAVRKMTAEAVQTQRDDERVKVGATTEPHAWRAYSAIVWLVLRAASSPNAVEGWATRWA